MTKMLRTVAWLTVLLTVALAPAQNASKKQDSKKQVAQKQVKPTTPATGTKLRKEILDSLRPPIENGLGVKVRFKVDRLSVLNGWAFLSGVLLDSKDRPIDLAKTRLKEEAEMMDGPSIYGLARFDAKKKKWVHVTHSIGPTDVAWSDWHVRFKCPKEILGIPNLLN